MPSAKPKVTIRLTRAQASALLAVACEGLEDLGVRISDEGPEVESDRAEYDAAERAIALLRAALHAAEKADP